jgi:hypothetical protein
MVAPGVIIDLLRGAMQDALRANADAGMAGWTHSRGRFLIDGFPRDMAQVAEFEEQVLRGSFWLGKVLMYALYRSARRL